ncbi:MULTISPECIES: hypothetical protein [unclassified Microbacterium]|uniref:hypothetical protein n=1 Tax=unclassified Microbacterium TaxID=2609290 RepID=UPI00214BBB6D|nr:MULTISPECIES: hypothetical protein [unclassified Microbacterium]MCR2810651.1 hypothetical protein [Microbacterium sp. zg.B185]WIM18188.1 hypothetical protein QNO12_11290 [Microbacterium sp. zg-B185]
MSTELAKCSSNKCWYCETRVVRDDFYVEHYRPKGRVDSLPSHPGYWWLAFDSSNYRFACKYCNERRVDALGGTSGGKLDRFPIVDESDRAVGEGDDIGRESPVLLDPTVPTDPALLDFATDGRVVASSEEPAPRRRAIESIEAYHLDHERLNGRRGQVASEVVSGMNRVRLTMRRLDEIDTADTARHAIARSEFTEALRWLAKYMMRDSEYTAAAKAMIREGKRETETYFDQLLEI